MWVIKDLWPYAAWALLWITRSISSKYETPPLITYLPGGSLLAISGLKLRKNCRGALYSSITAMSRPRHTRAP